MMLPILYTSLRFIPLLFALGPTFPVAPPNQLALLLESIGNNRFEIRLSDANENVNQRFAPPVVVRISIGGLEQQLSDVSTGQHITLRLSDESPRTAAFEELNLPTGAAGVYPMHVIAGPEGGATTAELKLNVRVECSNRDRKSYMECFLNCDRWEVSW